MSREVPEGWQLEKLGSFVEEFKVLDSAGDLPPLSVTKSSGIVFQSDKFNKRIANASSGNYKVIKNGEYSYDPMSLYYGAIGRLKVCDVGIVSPAYITFRLQGALDTIFFDLYIKTRDFLVHVNKVTTGGNQDGKRKKTDWNSFCSLPIALPPLHEQRRIAEILSSVDEAIAATRAVIEQTRKVKQGVLERLLTKGIGHTRFKQTEIGEIPEGWEVLCLEEIAEIDRGKFSVRPRNDPRYFGGDIPFVQTGDVVSADGRLIKHSQTLNQLGRGVSKEFPTGTILITIAANIGDTAITTYPVCCPDSVVGIVPNDGMNADWLREYLVLQKASLDRQATQNAQKNINLQHLRPLRVPVPSPDEQQRIGRRVEALNGAISNNFEKLANLISLKSALMSDLLTGRMRVTDALPMAAE
ncbi:restriction endonuclease subunit S [Pararhizobium sp. PWRC1-1]|uniref:restriction endonuclease subunit S n=1 Tax=Pararhizobium sp. PWRC1-1 TaxID=2804566 RepID=UPI003CE97D51